MAGLSNYEQNRILSSVFRDATYTKAATLYACLLTAAPTAGQRGPDLAETAYTSYARVAIATATGSWATPSAGQSSNKAVIQFPKSTGVSSVITHFALCDKAAKASGNIIAYGALTTTKTVNTDDTPQFAVGDLDIQMT